MSQGTVWSSQLLQAPKNLITEKDVDEDAQPLRLKTRGGMTFHRRVTKSPSIREHLDTSCEDPF